MLQMQVPQQVPAPMFAVMSSQAMPSRAIFILDSLVTFVIFELTKLHAHDPPCKGSTGPNGAHLKGCSHEPPQCPPGGNIPKQSSPSVTGFFVLPAELLRGIKGSVG